jgi:cell division protein FtsN
VGVAYYLMKAGNPYQSAVGAKEPTREQGKEPAKAARAEQAAPDKPRFDFYKILPGGEEPKVQPKAAERPAPDKATAERAAAPDKAPRAEERPAVATAKPPESPPPAKAADRFWLQAGSFANESDAENLKARLALSGWEAAVQQATLADKGVRFRVRLGPYDNTDELNRIKADLARKGFDVAVIRYQG